MESWDIYLSEIIKLNFQNLQIESETLQYLSQLCNNLFTKLATVNLSKIGDLEYIKILSSELYKNIMDECNLYVEKSHPNSFIEKLAYLIDKKSQQKFAFFMCIAFSIIINQTFVYFFKYIEKYSKLIGKNIITLSDIHIVLAARKELSTLFLSDSVPFVHPDNIYTLNGQLDKNNNEQNIPHKSTFDLIHFNYNIWPYCNKSEKKPEMTLVTENIGFNQTKTNISDHYNNFKSKYLEYESILLDYIRKEESLYIKDVKCLAKPIEIFKNPRNREHYNDLRIFTDWDTLAILTADIYHLSIKLLWGIDESKQTNEMEEPEAHTFAYIDFIEDLILVQEFEIYLKYAKLLFTQFAPFYTWLLLNSKTENGTQLLYETFFPHAILDDMQDLHYDINQFLQYVYPLQLLQPFLHIVFYQILLKDLITLLKTSLKDSETTDDDDDASKLDEQMAKLENALMSLNQLIKQICDICPDTIALQLKSLQENYSFLPTEMRTLDNVIEKYETNLVDTIKGWNEKSGIGNTSTLREYLQTDASDTFSLASTTNLLAEQLQIQPILTLTKPGKSETLLNEGSIFSLSCQSPLLMNPNVIEALPDIKRDNLISNYVKAGSGSNSTNFNSPHAKDRTAFIWSDGTFALCKTLPPANYIASHLNKFGKTTTKSPNVANTVKYPRNEPIVAKSKNFAMENIESVIRNIVTANSDASSQLNPMQKLLVLGFQNRNFSSNISSPPPLSSIPTSNSVPVTFDYKLINGAIMDQCRITSTNDLIINIQILTSTNKYAKNNSKHGNHFHSKHNKFQIQLNGASNQSINARNDTLSNVSSSTLSINRKIASSLLHNSFINLVAKSDAEHKTWMAYFVKLSVQKSLYKRLNKLIENDESYQPYLILKHLNHKPKYGKYTDPNYLVLEYKGDSEIPFVKAGTRDKLIERLCYPKYCDHFFLSTFLIVYRTFMPPNQLFQALIDRYNLPANLEDLDMDRLKEHLQKIYGTNEYPLADSDIDAIVKEILLKYKKEYLIPVQLRVLNVLRHWLNYHYYDFQLDPALLEKLRIFLVNLSFHKNKSRYVEMMQNLIHKRLEQTEKPKELVFDHPAPPIEWHLTRNPTDFNLFTLHPLEFARQLTLYEFELYRAIKPSELIGTAWTKHDKHKLSSNLLQMTKHSTKITYWLESTIINTENFEERCALMNRILEILRALDQMNNFNGLLEIISALNSAPVYRLHHTFEHVPPKLLKFYQDVCDIMLDRHYKLYRQKLGLISPPCVPFLGIYMSDILHLEEGNPNYIYTTSSSDPEQSFSQNGDKDEKSNGLPLNDKGGVKRHKLINFFKWSKVAQVCKDIQNYQNVHYNFTFQTDIQDYIKNIDPFATITEKDLDEDLYRKSLLIEPKDATTVKLLPKFPKKYGDINLKSPGLKPSTINSFSNNSSDHNNHNNIMKPGNSNTISSNTLPRCSLLKGGAGGGIGLPITQSPIINVNAKIATLGKRKFNKFKASATQTLEKTAKGLRLQSSNVSTNNIVLVSSSTIIPTADRSGSVSTNCSMIGDCDTANLTPSTPSPNLNNTTQINLSDHHEAKNGNRLKSYQHNQKTTNSSLAMLANTISNSLRTSTGTKNSPRNFFATHFMSSGAVQRGSTNIGRSLEKSKNESDVQQNLKLQSEQNTVSSMVPGKFGQKSCKNMQLKLDKKPEFLKLFPDLSPSSPTSTTTSSSTVPNTPCSSLTPLSLNSSINSASSAASITNLDIGTNNKSVKVITTNQQQNTSKYYNKINQNSNNNNSINGRRCNNVFKFNRSAIDKHFDLHNQNNFDGSSIDSMMNYTTKREKIIKAEHNNEHEITISPNLTSSINNMNNTGFDAGSPSSDSLYHPFFVFPNPPMKFAQSEKQPEEDSSTLHSGYSQITIVSNQTIICGGETENIAHKTLNNTEENNVKGKTNTFEKTMGNNGLQRHNESDKNKTPIPTLPPRSTKIYDSSTSPNLIDLITPPPILPRMVKSSNTNVNQSPMIKGKIKRRLPPPLPIVTETQIQTLSTSVASDDKPPPLPPKNYVHTTINLLNNNIDKTKKLTSTKTLTSVTLNTDKNYKSHKNLTRNIPNDTLSQQDPSDNEHHYDDPCRSLL